MRHRSCLTGVRVAGVLLAFATPAAARDFPNVPALDNSRPTETPSITPLPDNKPCAYPPAAQRLQVAGPVLYTAQVRPDGTVESVDIRRVPARDLGFEEATRTCLSEWRFDPATADIGLRQYDGKVNYRIAVTGEVAARALLEAFASAWNTKNAEVIASLHGEAEEARAASPASVVSLAEQFTRQRAEADWNMELEPDLEQIRFWRPDLAVVRQPFHRRSTGTSSSAAGESSLLEATVMKRGEQWTLLGWYPIAGPPSPQRWLAPGIEEPRALRHVDPIYPGLALQSRVSAPVILAFRVDTRGEVESVRILRGHPLLDEAALEAVKKWQYAPMILPVVGILTVDFSLAGRGGRVSVEEHFALGPFAGATSPPAPPESGQEADARAENSGGLHFQAQGPSLASSVASHVPVITPEVAQFYADRDVVVQGRVDQVGSSEDGKTLFLNLGGRYPDQLFSAVISSGDLQSLPDVRSWEGKILEIRGKIRLYKGRGKPEIILQRPEQVTIDSGTPLLQGAPPQRQEDRDEVGSVSGVRPGTTTGPVTDYDSPPRPVKITRPPYPQEAFVKEIEGIVVVEILIDAQGRVARARVIQSVPLLDAAALHTVYQWVFQPAIKHGRPVPTIAHAPLVFRVYGRQPLTHEQRKQRQTTPPATPASAPSGDASNAPQGKGQNLGGLYFDPQGADFTLWVQRFKDEVYRNWILPQAAYFNFRGHVDFVFTVERNGSISSLRMEKSSGTASFDKAAEFALTRSQLLPLPDDYGPPRLTIRVTFYYNEAPPRR